MRYRWDGVVLGAVIGSVVSEAEELRDDEGEDVGRAAAGGRPHATELG